MKRNSILHRLWNNAVPPFIRDNEKLFRFLCTTQQISPKLVDLVIDFRRKHHALTHAEYNLYYEKLSHLIPYTPKSSYIGNHGLNFILDYAKKNSQLKSFFDCSCGGGGLTFKLSEAGKMATGMDIVLNESLKNSTDATFVEGDILNIPFEDNSFDVVISCHTLEHIIKIQDAVAELRRVSNHTLIIIVPCQRESKYTLDFHVHFFPYAESFHRIMGNPNAKCFYLDGDILYIEEDVHYETN